MTAQVVRKIDKAVLEARLRQEANRKFLERFNTSQNTKFRTTIGDLVK